MRGKALIAGVGALVILGVFLFIWHFFFSSWDIVNLPPKNETIVALGDSLVFGVGSTRGNDFVSLLSKKTGREIINLGVPGDTTADGLLRIDDVLSHDPGIVIVLLGGNDALRRISRDKTYENLTEILQKLTNNGSAVILVGVRGGLLDDPYDTMFEQLAKENGATLVPNVLEGILLRPELTEDQIHPNNAGYVIVADRIYKALKPLLNN